jgi:sigma-E factor negative regulatory protein RseB
MIRPVTVLLIALLAGVASAEDDPQRWLDDMNRAFAELSYDGIASHYSGQELATLRIVHMVVDGEQRERLVHLNGAPRQIVRRGKEIVCMVAPDDALLALGESVTSGPFAGAFVRRYDGLSELYGLSFFGEDRVADRAAVRLAVMPHDEHRYGYRLWLDRETRLLLRSELIDAEGNRLEIFQFNQIVIGDAVDPGALEADDADGTLVSQLTLATEDPQPVGRQDVDWQAGWLPDGFALAGADVRTARGSDRPVTRMLYSDGLAAFSLFIEALPGPDVTPMESRDGATVAVAHLLAGDTGQAEQADDAGLAALDARPPHLVTVVGEIPVLTARRIAESIRPRPGS